MKNWPHFILQGRYYWLLFALFGTAFMLWKARSVEISQDFVKVIPENDPDYQYYRNFQKTFGEDAALILIGVEIPQNTDSTFWEGLRHFAARIRALSGVRQTLSVTELPTLKWQASSPVIDTIAIYSASDWQSIRQKLPFYKGLLWDSTGQSTLILVNIDSLTLHTRAKHELLHTLKTIATETAQALHIRIHLGGVPYLRHEVAQLVPRELILFTIASLILTVLALYAYFRSWYAVIFPVLLLGLTAIWTLGVVGLYGYKLTLLTALLPPLIVILGIPPAIYMIGEYHRLYVAKGDKVLAIREMIRDMGFVTLMIHANNAFAFLTLYLTQVVPLQEFGLVAFWGTMASYLLTVLLLPSVLMILPAPTAREVRHLENKWVLAFLRWVGRIVQKRRPVIYLLSAIFLIVGGIGVLKLRAVSYMADDLPQSAAVIEGQAFFQERYGGMLPFEIVIDTERPQGLRRMGTLRAIAALQDSLRRYRELSRSLSIVDGLYWLRQAYYGGNPATYRLPLPEELPVLLRSTQKAHGAPLLSALTDSTWQKARITAFVRDIGSADMPRLLAEIQHTIQNTFGSDAPKVHVTGTTLIFLKAIDYLVDNLIWSLVATFILVALQMFFLYGSLRVMLISMGVNIVPLFLVAGLMGFGEIPLKPSTALIFEMAFGIVIDSAVRYLSSYQWYYRRHPWPERAAIVSLHHTGALIIYTSFVLLAGFVIFIPSSFGGTKSLGILTALSIVMGVFSNLFLLPAMLITFRQADEGRFRKYTRAQLTRLREKRAARRAQTSPAQKPSSPQ